MPTSEISTIRFTTDVDPESSAGALLHQARKRAGLSQAELAARAGITQSVISAYESGHRQPSIPVLAALVDAAGYELVMDVRRQPRRLGRLSGPVGRRVRRHRHDLVAAAAAHGVQNLRVFGSVARGEDRPDSDVDLLADLPAGRPEPVRAGPGRGRTGSHPRQPGGPDSGSRPQTRRPGPRPA